MATYSPLYRSPVTATASGGSVSDNNFSVAGDVSNTVSNQTNKDPRADAVLTINPSVAPDSNGSISLFSRSLNIDGPNDQPTPSANHQSHWVGTFVVNSSTGTQSLPLDEFKLPPYQCEFYIKNESGQATGSWTLTIIPWTYQTT